MIKNGCGQSSRGIVMLAVYEEKTDGINWVSMVENWHDLLAYGTLKFQYLKNELMNWADFLAC